MSSSFNRIKKNIIEAMQSTNNQGTSAYDSVAEVRRVEGDTAWVHIPGGVDETPVARAISAQPGDTVRIRVSGGSAWIVGNETAPPTDDSAANKAIQKTNQVELLAKSAKKSADDAQETADGATAKIETIDGQITALVADVEGNSASITQQATQIQSMVSDIEENSTAITQTSKDLTIEINNAKQAADDAESDAEEAKSAASNALSTANSASATASSAYSEAMSAARTATNYIRANSSGVQVFYDDYNYSTVGSDGFYITKDGNVVARFTGSVIDLSKVLHISKSTHDSGTALISTYQQDTPSTLIPLNILASSICLATNEVYIGSRNSVCIAATKNDLNNIYTIDLNRSEAGSGNLIFGSDIDGGNAAVTGWVSDHFVKKSDRRVKENIKTLDEESTVSLYESFRPVSFNYKDIKDTDTFYTDATRFGFIAQEVEESVDKVEPNSGMVVTTTKYLGEQEKELCPDGMKKIDYDEFHALHVVYARYLEKRITELEKRVATLEEQIIKMGGETK